MNSSRQPAWQEAIRFRYAGWLFTPFLSPPAFRHAAASARLSPLADYLPPLITPHFITEAAADSRIADYCQPPSPHFSRFR